MPIEADEHLNLISKSDPLGSVPVVESMFVDFGRVFDMAHLLSNVVPRPSDDVIRNLTMDIIEKFGNTGGKEMTRECLSLVIANGFFSFTSGKEELP